MRCRWKRKNKSSQSHRRRPSLDALPRALHVTSPHRRTGASGEVRPADVLYTSRVQANADLIKGNCRTKSKWTSLNGTSTFGAQTLSIYAKALGE